MPRGGARQGRPGQQYANRSDLQNPQVPVTTVPGQTYGAAGEQAAAQRAIPMAGAPMIGGQGGGDGAASQPPPVPGAPHLLLSRPTERPDEPVTAGLPSGPGPGPEAHTGIGALAVNGTMDADNVAGLLQTLASRPGASQAVQLLASRSAQGAQ